MRHARCAIPLVLATTLAGCIGYADQPPIAEPIPPQTNHSYLPSEPVHFVEHRRRGSGTFVETSAGFDNGFRADWKAVLLPPPGSGIDGPTWNGTNLHGDEAKAAHASPDYRDGDSLRIVAGAMRERWNQPAVWLIGTDPLILGLPADRTPPDSIVRQLRFASANDSNQLLVAIVAFPPGVDWECRQLDRMRLSYVQFDQPQTIDGVLTELTKSDPQTLGRVKMIGFFDHLDGTNDDGRHKPATSTTASGSTP